MSIDSESGRLHTGLVTGRYGVDGKFKNLEMAWST